MTVIGGRNPEFERHFLEGAERRIGLTSSGFRDRVFDRLAQAEREKGADAYLALGIPRLLHEIREEGLDIGGWPVLLAEALYAEDVDDDVALEVRLIMQEIAAHGAMVDHLVNRAGDLLAD